MKMEHSQKRQKINRITSKYYANLNYGKLEDLNISNYFDEEIPVIIDSEIEITIKQSQKKHLAWMESEMRE